MKKILIVTALSQELNSIKEKIKKLKMQNLKISYFTTWVWNYYTILNFTRFLEQNKDFDFIVNIWVCGYKEEKKDFFQVARIFNSANKKELIVPNLFDFWDLESIFCSEKIIFDWKDILEEKFCDMESFWFELVCESFSIPRMILKVPVDKIGDETENFDFLKAKKYLQENIDYELLLTKILDYLNKKTAKKDFSKFLNYYNLTFSENIIFERNIYKFEALVKKDFSLYFDENKEKTKENFLKDLDLFLKEFIL